MALNEQQQTVVQARLENILVLAGAGTGKTTVLIERIVHILENHFLNPENLMVITFTRKAGYEIIGRLEKRLAPNDAAAQKRLRNSIAMGTFHSVFNKMLRTYVEAIPNLDRNFTVIDPDDAKRYCTKLAVAKKLKFALDNWNTSLSDLISNAKESLLDIEALQLQEFKNFIQRAKSKDYADGETLLVESEHLKLFKECYAEYQQYLRSNNQIDLSDILLISYELLAHNEQLRQHIQQRYRYIMVDECQDMNILQYELIKLLHDFNVNRTFFVGDDDQAIYGFRGADPYLIKRYQHEFARVQTYKLEYNYRCSPAVINIANHIINREKVDNIKTLIAAKAETANARVNFYFEEEERQMLDRLIGNIEAYADDLENNSTAIITRYQRQLDAIEMRLVTKGIPCIRLTGFNFFRREEIKIIINYIKLIINLEDNAAYTEVVNVPPRSIGAKTLESIVAFARDQGMPHFLAHQRMVTEKVLGGASSSKHRAFIDKVVDLHRQLPYFSLAQLIEKIVQSFELKEYFGKMRDDLAGKRMENILAFTNMVKTYVADFTNYTAANLHILLNDLALEYPEATRKELLNVLVMREYVNTRLFDVEQAQKNTQGVVNLSSVHGVKGLEFKHVHMYDFNDGCYPSAMSGSIQEYEEERRVVYVAFTRAKEHLNLYTSRRGQMFGQWIERGPSEFLYEMLEIPVVWDLHLNIPNRKLSSLYERARGAIVKCAQAMAEVKALYPDYTRPDFLKLDPTQLKLKNRYLVDNYREIYCGMKEILIERNRLLFGDQASQETTVQTAHSTRDNLAVRVQQVHAAEQTTPVSAVSELGNFDLEREIKVDLSNADLNLITLPFPTKTIVTQAHILANQINAGYELGETNLDQYVAQVRQHYDAYESINKMWHAQEFAFQLSGKPDLAEKIVQLDQQQLTKIVSNSFTYEQITQALEGLVLVGETTPYQVQSAQQPLPSTRFSANEIATANSPIAAEINQRVTSAFQSMGSSTQLDELFGVEGGASTLVIGSSRPADSDTYLADLDDFDLPEGFDVVDLDQPVGQSSGFLDLTQHIELRNYQQVSELRNFARARWETGKAATNPVELHGYDDFYTAVQNLEKHQVGTPLEGLVTKKARKK